MTRSTVNKEYEVTYEMIIKSYLNELKEKGKKVIEYEALTNDEKLEIIAHIIKKAKNPKDGKGINFFMKHIIQSNVLWYHEKWNKLHMQYRNLTIVASRGLGKTYWASHIIPMYHSFVKLQFFPSHLKSPKRHESMIIGYNETMAKKFLADPRDTIETNELLSNLIGTGANTDWNKLQLDLGNKSSIIARSFAGAIRGFHEAGVVVCDDLLSDKSEISPDLVNTSLNNIVKPITRRFRAKNIIVGTRFSEDDIYSKNEDRAKKDTRNLYGYYVVWVKLNHDEEKVYICEYDSAIGEVVEHLDTGITDIYDYYELKEAQENDPISFSREYECKVVSSSEIPFPLDYLVKCKDYDLSYEKYSNNHHYKGGMDSSNSTNKDSDDTVLMLGYLNEDIDVILANIFADNTMAAPERIESIKNRMREFGRPEVLTEKNNMGTTNIDFINKENYQLIPFNTSRLSKIDLTEFAEKLVKKYKVKFPYKTPEDRRITDKVIRQLNGVREKKTRTGLRSYEGFTKHDDHYIAFILMCKQLHNGMGKTKVRSYNRSNLR